MTTIPGDPVSGDLYPRLPWEDIGIGLLAEAKDRQTVAMTHHRLVTQAMAAPTAAERLEALGVAVGDVFVRLNDEDGARLATEWRTLLADVASCGTGGLRGWAAAFGESTANWWPPGSSWLTRGIVNAVVRSPTVEDLHAGDRPSFYDTQLGTMCANWAAVSLLDPVLGPDPSSWGLTDSEIKSADRTRLYAAAGRDFPAGWTVIEALGRCVDDSTNYLELDLPPIGTAEEATQWLAEHAGTVRKLDLEPMAMKAQIARSDATVRHAWSAPLPEELDQHTTTRAIATPSLTRLSRHPLHLAATLQWAIRSGVRVLTPNVFIEPPAVSYRIPPVATPAIDVDPKEGQATHSDSWKDPNGLSFTHAQALNVGTTHTKVGRNDPCPCGPGVKYKRCHGR